MAIVEWTETQVEKLVKMKGAGMSARDIAESLDFSRNAVLGKIYRMGLSAKGHRNRGGRPAGASARAHSGVSTPRKKRTVQAEPAKPITKVEASDYDIGRLKHAQGLPTLEKGQCHWPVHEVEGEPGRHLFCAADVHDAQQVTRPESVYCSHHLSRRTAPARTGS